MAFIDSKHLPLSDEFKDILLNFTLEALKKRPKNLYEFAYRHFSAINQGKPRDFSRLNLFQKKERSWISSRNASSEEDFELNESKPQQSEQRFVMHTHSYNPEDEISHKISTQILTLKSDQEKETLKQLLARVTIFKNLCDDELNEVTLHMHKLNVNRKDVIIQQNDPGEYFYIIQTGKFDVYVKDSFEGIKYMSSYNNQGSFGELALLYDAPRAATIIAKTAGTLWYMNKQTFKSIIIMKAHIKKLRYVNFISSISLFKYLSNDQRIAIAEAIHMKVFQQDEVIVAQGKVGKHMYFIESGRVAVVVEINKIRKTVATLEKADYFGELSLLSNRPRAASIVAIEKTVVATLDKSNFNKLMKPFLEILKQSALNYEHMWKRAFYVEDTSL